MFGGFEYWSLPRCKFREKNWNFLDNLYLDVKCEKWDASSWNERRIWNENNRATADQSITVRVNLAAWGRSIPTIKSNKKQKIVWVKSGEENFRTTVLNIEKLQKITLLIKGLKNTYQCQNQTIFYVILFISILFCLSSLFFKFISNLSCPA